MFLRVVPSNVPNCNEFLMVVPIFLGLCRVLCRAVLIEVLSVVPCFLSSCVVPSSSELYSVLCRALTVFF